MLEIKNITKDYVMKNDTVNALKGVNICFRKSEFVSILGQSGCGKTTLLNIIGGLDRYTSGDLIINGVSTKEYKDKDWDTYRNHSIGFVFQSYNLIPHQTALKNVELALSIGGISRKERKQRAIEALNQVGLGEQINKKPNQMSGGQCQRVAIARALVNNPDIILADEPTGALDSKTSVQIMELLKEVSKNRLVIMVTHNPELAETYSTRIIRMKDGEVLSDSKPVTEKEKEKELKTYKKQQEKLTEKEIKQKRKKSSMSLWSSFVLSGSNLLTKKRRTFIIALACSIGIIGIAVILSVSTGMHTYVNKLERDSKSANFVFVGLNISDMDSIIEQEKVDLPEYPKDEIIYPYEEKSIAKYGIITPEFIDYIENKVNGDTEETSLVTAIEYSRNLKLYNSDAKEYNNWSEMLDNPEFINKEYTALACLNNKPIPTEANEVALVVDKYNRVKISTLESLGIDVDADLTGLDYSTFLGKTLDVSCALNNEIKTYSLTITSILRQNKKATNNWLSTGINYTKAFVDGIIAETNVKIPVTTMMLYPKDFDTKDEIINALEEWNNTEIYKIYGNTTDANGNYIADNYKIIYTDMGKLLVSMLDSLIDIITYALVAFSSISLVVSSIMIAIITYSSVIERIKEIGTIRSLGGRKKDIANIFRVEACIIGAVSAIIALISTLIINGIINLILGNLVGVKTIATLSLPVAFWMIVLAVGLNLIASLIPASIAAKKDPVVALRTE